MFSLQQFHSRDQMVTALGDGVATQLQQAIEENGAAVMAVSGGNSPKPLFEYLSSQNIDWPKVTITLVDERWVDDRHPDANAKLVKDYLLQNNAGSARFVPLYNGAPTPFEAEPAVDQVLSQLRLPIDVVILGMGEDGHTASFFPQAPTLARALDLTNKHLCCAIEPITAPHQRMTLTLSALLQGKYIYLLVTGESKWTVLEQAMESHNDSHDQFESFKALPVRSVLQQSTHPVEIFYAP